MIYLHKILPLLVSPLSLVIFLVLIGTIFKKRKIIIFGMLILVFCSLPIISSKLISFLEKDYQPIKISNVEVADAIVVLGGVVKILKKNETILYEFNGSVDRILAGIDLYKKNKAPILILTRGKLPWSIGKPEGEFLKEFAVNSGIPKQNIILTENVENTEQEAKSVKKLLLNNNSKIILVTSAFHMDRAKKNFEAANIKVINFPVDFKSSLSKFTFMNLIPSASSLNNTSHFVREMIGRLYYELKYLK